MENASKALLMAGAVLIGVMLLSLGVYLFQTFGNSSKQISKQLTDAQISEFNSQFLKYEGIKTCRAHDVVSIANLARQNNEKYYGQNYGADAQNEPYYISVKINANDINTNHFENSGEDKYQDLMKNYSLQNNLEPYYFDCSEIDTNPDTKLVIKVVFSLI